MFALFKFREKHGLTQREEEAAAAVAYDFTRRTSRTVLCLIDAYRNEKVVPMAANALKLFSAKLSHCRQDENFDRIVQTQLEFEETVKKMSQAALSGVWHSLRAWHFTLTGSGLKSELDRYIALTFGNIWTHVEERATDEANALISQISGEAMVERDAEFPKARGSGSR